MTDPKENFKRLVEDPPKIKIEPDPDPFVVDLGPVPIVQRDVPPIVDILGNQVEVPPEEVLPEGRPVISRRGPIDG